MRSLEDIAEFLNTNGWNYTVFLMCYEGPSSLHADLDSAVGRLVGSEVVVEDLGQVEEAELLAEVASCLSFVGSDGEGVEPQLVESGEFRSLLIGVMNDAKHLASRASTIRRLRILEGHPAYPVFWEFAFLFTASSKLILFIGSSSD